MYRIGVDVGGTNTDSAILDITKADSSSRGVLASCKTPTTADVTSGIARAVEDVLAKSKVNKADVLSVNIGTTRFVNAVVEADKKRLSRVAVVRLCGPGEAICSQELRYGLRVSVIGMPAHPLWTGDERGLKVGGPEGFGLNMEWKSVGEYEMPRSVIDDIDVV